MEACACCGRTDTTWIASPEPDVVLCSDTCLLNWYAKQVGWARAYDAWRRGERTGEVE